MQAERKRIVGEGYVGAAERHAAWAQHTRIEERARYINLLLELLPEAAAVLELAYGNGILVARELAERFAVTGVDLSARHVQLAQSNVANATFLQGGMTALDLAAESCDAVTAFYPIIHAPRKEHPGLLRDIARWLRPGGVFVAALGFRSAENAYELDWFGVPIYFSRFDSPTNQQLEAEAGLHLLAASEETADEDGAPVTFLWVVAQKASCHRPPAEAGSLQLARNENASAFDWMTAARHDRSQVASGASTPTSNIVRWHRFLPAPHRLFR